MEKDDLPRWYYKEPPLEKELRLLVRKFRIWYFDNPKDKFEKWMKRIERMFLVWVPLLTIMFQVAQRMR